MVFNEDWFKVNQGIFSSIFYNKNKSLWKKIWDLIGARAWTAGYIQAHVKFGLQSDKPTLADVKELRFPSARKYFEEHGMSVIKDLTETDMNRLFGALVQNYGIGEKAFARKYKESYSFAPSRLKNIYRTETHMSQRFAQTTAAKEAGLQTKTWYAVGDEATCPICGELNGETVPINQPYSNGEYVAHGHPRCRCQELYK
jgi:SPP1 gp7 family putative phage head morphogenesis protein